MLYHPFRDENQLFPNDPEKCEELYLKHFDEIKVVKGHLMPFLESVEEAQLIYEEMKAQEKQDVQDKMGADLDPENEQDIADLDDEDYDEEHPDFYHIDTMEENPESDHRSRQVFKAVALPSKPAQVILNYSRHHLSNILFLSTFSQVEEARHLDMRQKQVLSIALHYAKRLRTYSGPTPSSKPSSSVHKHFQNLPNALRIHQTFS